MSDRINLSHPDWANVPSECPNCGVEFKQSLSKKGIGKIQYDYNDGESEYGEYTQLQCDSCDLIIQRHYKSNDVSAEEDHLVNPSDWVYRAQELENETSLKHREAQVQALKENEKSHSEIGEILDISKSTVGEYSRRIDARTEESIRTLEEIGQTIDPLRHIEGQFDGWVITPTERWSCANCETELAAGDEAVVAAEFVGRSWQLVEVFCTECLSDDYVSSVDDEEFHLTEFIRENRGYGVTCVFVEGDLERQGDDYVPTQLSPDSKRSLTLRNPTVQEILN